MLELSNVEAMYQGVVLAIKGVSLVVPKGGCVALLGANGVGKSTVLKSVSGLLRSEEGRVTGGRIVFEGQSIEEMEADRIVRLGISHVLEGRRPLEHLTVEQNLIAGGATLSNGRALRDRLKEVYSVVPRLGDLRTRTAGYLSGGEQQLMVIGRALMASPKLMLLDEPSLGLAPKMIEEIYRVLARLRATGLALLIVEQNARVALDMADHAYVVEGGRIVMEGTSGQIAANEDVREFYLGFSASGARKSFREVKHYRRRKRWMG
jgi:branched-chain amino acid transport system ATP-binding protein